jgi:5-methylcytosine-specific restriction endonuclease McrA
MKFELKPFNRNVPDKDLLADLVLAHSKLSSEGKSLTYHNYRAVGKYGPSTINDRFRTWNNALQKAGIALNEEKNVPVETLFDNLKLAWIAKGKQPTFRDMSVAPSQYTASIYNDRFGSWRKALERFVASVDHEESELLSYEVEFKKRSGTKRTKRDPSLALRFFVLKRDSFRCVGCGRSPATVAGLVLEVDHVIAWANGGETIESNLRTLCFDCNRGKGAT